MALLGPRELDVGWFVFLHRFFQDIADFFGVPGLPGFLRRSDVERCYQELTGCPLRDMDFYGLVAPGGRAPPGQAAGSALVKEPSSDHRLIRRRPIGRRIRPQADSAAFNPRQNHSRE